MIKKDVDKALLSEIFKLYKSDYELSKSPFIHNLVYVIDNKIVSFIVYSISYENLEILDVYTVEKNRNENIATMLLQVIINENHDKSITLEVSEKNVIAINLYEKLGFKKVAIRKNYYKDSNGILMLKK